MLKRTPLFAAHQALGGKLVEFGGWEMPVQYSSIMDEHHAVRKAAGVFDISHMGEVSIRGAASSQFLNGLLTNDIRKLRPGEGQYTLMCNDRGGVIDDLYVYQLGDAGYLLIINASRIAADFEWITRAHAAFSGRSNVEVANQSDETGAVAVQGPAVACFIDACFSGPSQAGMRVSKASDLKKNEIGRFKLGNSEVWLSRTGYTGEDGFEAVAPADKIIEVWNGVLQKGSGHGLKPAGLGARDTLRTEACYPLYGHELDEKTTPIEAGLSFFVALDKGEFTGRTVLADQKASGTSRKLVAFKSAERSAPPRPGYPIWASDQGGQVIGQVSSGTQSPTLGVGIGMGFVSSGFARPESAIYVEARGRRWPAAICRKPLYRKPN